jgi:cyclase
VLNEAYHHSLETAEDFDAAVDEIREQPLFTQISSELDLYSTPHDPETWSSPKDATAREFYSWDADPAD